MKYQKKAISEDFCNKICTATKIMIEGAFICSLHSFHRPMLLPSALVTSIMGVVLFLAQKQVERNLCINRKESAIFQLKTA